MFTGNEQQDAYGMPQLQPLYPRGPYEYPSVTGLLLSYEIEPELARDVVPAPLEVRDPPTCLFGVYDYEHVNGLGAYEELMIGVSARYEGDPVTYTPYSILDSDAAIGVGREVWGIPKKHGQVALDLTGEVVTARISRGGVELAVATAETTQSMEQHPLGQSLRNVHWKRIPSASKEAPPQVNRLVTSVNRDIDVEWTYRVVGDLQLSHSAADPIAVFGPSGEVTGYLLKGSWVLDQEEDAVLHRFEEA